LIDQLERRTHANDVARRLTDSPRWSWSVGLVFTWNGRSLIVVGVTDRNSVLAHFLGQGVGVELGLDEHDLFPDLLHSTTAGVLFERWTRAAYYASIQADRFRLTGPRPEKHTRVRAVTGAWALIMDPGSQIAIHSDDDLGVAAAEALLALWERRSRMTPASFKAVKRPDPES
jgi:hypothetical protein